jgi:hypothetical protein
MSYCTGNAQCQLCPVGTFKRNGDTGCVTCWVSPATIQCLSPTGGIAYCSYGSVTSGPGMTQQIDCKCPAGFIGSSYDKCKPCRWGTIQPTINVLPYNYYFPAQQESDSTYICETCAQGKISGGIASRIGFYTAPWAGWTTNIAANECINCEVGKYAGESNSRTQQSFNGLTATTCSDCPVGRSSLALSISPSACQCPAAYEGANSVADFYGMYSFATCTLCAAGTYKSDLGSACSSCALGKTSLPGSTAESNCRDIIKCNTGYTGPDDGICTTCASGSYKPTVGSQSCTLCDANTYGTVVAVISVMSCVACPGNSTSVAGSSQNTSCQCNRGYSGPNGGPCDACLQAFTRTQ